MRRRLSVHGKIRKEANAGSACINANHEYTRMDTNNCDSPEIKMGKWEE